MPLCCACLATVMLNVQVHDCILRLGLARAVGARQAAATFGHRGLCLRIALLRLVFD